MKLFLPGLLTTAMLVTGGCTNSYQGSMASWPTNPKHESAESAAEAPAASSEELETIDAEDAAYLAALSGRADAAAMGQAPSAAFVSPVSLYGELPGAARQPRGAGPDNLQQLSFARDAADYDVTVDATGEFVVFASTRHRPKADIYMKQVEGMTVRQLTDDPAADVMPAISPDGKHVAFASDRGGSWDIYVQPLDGGKAMQVTHSPEHELHPNWAPDSKTLAFCQLSQQSGQWEMALVDLTRDGTRKFIGFGLFPEFSPDGGKILFQRARQRDSRLFSVWTLDYENGQARRPTEIVAANNAAIINPTWSPDGSRIAFATVVDPSNEPGGRPEKADLWSIRIDGTQRIKLTSDRYSNLQPAWGGDGTIYFVSDRAGFDNIWALRAQPSSIAARAEESGEPQAMVDTE